MSDLSQPAIGGHRGVSELETVPQSLPSLHALQLIASLRVLQVVPVVLVLPEQIITEHTECHGA